MKKLSVTYTYFTFISRLRTTVYVNEVTLIDVLIKQKTIIFAELFCLATLIKPQVFSCSYQQINIIFHHSTYYYYSSFKCKITASHPVYVFHSVRVPRTYNGSLTNTHTPNRTSIRKKSQLYDRN